MWRFFLIVICSFVSSAALGQHTSFNGAMLNVDYAAAQAAAAFAAQDSESGSSDTNGSHATKISNNFTVGTSTYAYWMIRWNGVVQIASVRLSGSTWFWIYAGFGNWTNYASSFPGYNNPTPTPTPTPPPGWEINVNGTFTDDYAGSVVTYLCTSTGQVLMSTTLTGGAYSATLNVPSSCASVDMYVNDVLFQNFTSADVPPGGLEWGNIEKTPVTLSVGPGVNGGGFAGSTNSDGTFVNAPITDSSGNVIGYVGTNVPVQYELRYVSGAPLSKFSVNQLIYEGVVPGGSTSVVSTNLALRAGAIYSVSAAVPTFQWVYPGDGMDPLLIPVSTNYVTNIVSLPGGLGPQSVYVPGPLLPNPGTITNPAVAVTNNTTNNITNSPGIVVGTNTSPVVTNEPTVDIGFDTLGLDTEDYGEEEVLERAAGLLGIMQEGLDSWLSGIEKLNSAIQTISGLTPPSGGSGCTLSMGMVNINLGVSPWPGVRSMLVYGVYLVAVFGAAKLVLSIFD